MQSGSPAQVVLQAVVEAQTYCPQVPAAGVAQVPIGPPEQNGWAVKVVPEQVGPLHITEVLACVQAPAPLQAPVLPQVVVTGQRPCGSARPPLTLAQVPGLAAVLHTWQVGQLALPQHTPSTQLPLLHSWLPPQAAPVPLVATQLPPVPVQ